MSESSITFNDRKIKKSNFYKTKKLFKIEDIDVDRILISKKRPYGKKDSFKYFIAYDDNGHIGLLLIMLPQMTGYVKCSDNHKAISFKIADYNLLKMYTKIWERVTNLMNIEFDSELVYGANDNVKHIKTKIKMYEGKVNTDFQGKEVPKENDSYDCSSLIILDSVIRANKKYFPQARLEECKYKIRKNRRYNLINDDLEPDTESDNESGNYEFSDCFVNYECVLIIS